MVIMMAELKKALSDYDNKESDKGGSCGEKVIAGTRCKSGRFNV